MKLKRISAGHYTFKTWTIKKLDGGFKTWCVTNSVEFPTYDNARIFKMFSEARKHLSENI
jgi:hypothetical protein